MLHRFLNFEIDEDARELRSGSRVLLLQPRVFDLLVYLARNRERVVPKDELLEKLWPGVIVTDGSLQRAVSLARTALAEAGAGDAIRTYSRQGYRFCADPGAPVDLESWQERQSERGDAPADDLQATIAQLQERDQLEGLSGDDLQRWAYAAHCAGRTPEAIRLLERTVAAYSARGDRRLAGWACTLLANLNLEWREVALAKGWWCRAQRLLGAGQSPELAYLHVVGARLAFVENNLDEAVREADLARELGRGCGNANIESLGLTF
ncbi:MAG TPA: winged helix-turn-helix domain-containing protein, partial [Opitutaceae bacterium]